MQIFIIRFIVDWNWQAKAKTYNALNGKTLHHLSRMRNFRNKSISMELKSVNYAWRSTNLFSRIPFKHTNLLTPHRPDTTVVVEFAWNRTST